MTRHVFVFSLLFLVMACSQATTTQPVDLLITNGRVFTGDPAKPFAESVAIRGSRIVAVGSGAELGALAADAKRIVDAGGRLVVPGINDAHVHAPSSGAPDNIEIGRTASADDVLTAVRNAAANHAAGTWLRGTMPVPLIGDARMTRDALDSVAPNHPVLFEIVSGHAGLLNSRALAAWSISDTTPDPKGGWYARSEGRLTGWIYEHALWEKLAADQLARSDAEIIERMDEFAASAVRYGITSVQSMPLANAERVASLLSRTKIPLRWRFMDLQMAKVEESPRTAVKYILDGTPMERGAAMREDYSDQPGHRGRPNYSDEELAAIVRTAARTDQQLLLHISGDRMLEQLLAEMKKHSVDWRTKRVRIEHGDFIGEFLPEAAAAGVLLVQNPTHFLFPEVMVSRFGSERTVRFAALASALKLGIPVAIGSDGPLNPWLNLMVAASHPRNPSEALTREQALAAYTRGAAYAEFAEEDKGTIEAGKLADLAILSQDIFTVPLEALPGTESVLTVIGGRIVHERGK